MFSIYLLIIYYVKYDKYLLQINIYTLFLFLYKQYQIVQI